METQGKSDNKRGRGRPKKFDRSVALEQAMRLFWEHGYEGTTFDQLIEAMSISPSSFYNAFGSKERLYEEAISLYLARSSEWFMAALAAGTHAKMAFHGLLSAAARQFTQTDRPTGCMVSLACTTVSPALDPLRDLAAGMRRSAQQAMADRLRRAIESGELPEDTDAEALAGFYAAVSRGMAVLARDGASYEQLQSIVDLSMRAWPSAAGGTSSDRRQGVPNFGASASTA
jgi:AcrR family transcriptional regulator